jgi:5-methylthioribose kinase
MNATRGSIVHITTETVGSYLYERGVVSSPQVTATELTGGVSGRVLLVEAEGVRLVTKQAHARLTVATEWLASPRRAQTEAAAMSMLSALTPDSVPALIDSDAENCALTMTAAPPGFRAWKDVLLDQEMPAPEVVRTAGVLGDLVGRWHRRTWADASVAARFDDYDAFESLRISPFHRTILSRHADLATVINHCIEQLMTGRQCLVHGDLSPKNVLVGSGEPWVIDHEVAHFGAAVFDLAFLHCHLLLKAVHQPGSGQTYARAAATFLQAYAEHVDLVTTDDLPWQIACLLLARVDGKSPAGYLTAGEQTTVRRVARKILSTDSPTLEETWTLVTGSAR